MRFSADIDTDKKYQLLQLTPQLEKSLKEGALYFRSSAEGSVFACTNETTHLVRILKQTNTLLLSQSPAEAESVAFASVENLLETVLVPAKIDWSQVPQYRNKKDLNVTRAEAPFEMCCSSMEFKEKCREQPATYIKETLYQISLDTVHDILVEMVSSMVELGDIDLKTPLKSLNLDLNHPAEVVECVYAKFVQEDTKASLQLDINQISHFCGLYVLEQNAQGLSRSEFLKEWRLDLPIKMNNDLESLYGHIVIHNPDTSPIVEALHESSLPVDPKLRFHRLFTIKPEWPLPEIEPFIHPLVPGNQKLESWVLKFAKKKRVGTGISLIPLRR